MARDDAGPVRPFNMWLIIGASVGGFIMIIAIILICWIVRRRKKNNKLKKEQEKMRQKKKDLEKKKVGEEDFEWEPKKSLNDHPLFKSQKTKTDPMTTNDKKRTADMAALSPQEIEGTNIIKTKQT